MPTPDDYNNNQPGLLQRGPTSLLPPIPPSQNDNDPTKTQVAAVPRVPPPTPRTDRPPTPGDAQPTPPTPQQAAPYTPVPWHAQPPPPAPPTPPLGNWTTDQVAPWLGPHLATLPGPLVPNREPDGYKGNQPVYNLRPGEPGYTVGGNSNILTGAVSWLESRNNGPFGDPSTLGQKAAFQAQYGAGPQGVTNYAHQLLRANPNATFGDFYAGYALGTGDPRRAPTLEDLRTKYPEAYRNLINNFPASQGGAQPGTPSGPQGPWTQQNLEANFAERTGALGQAGHVPLTTVTSPNGQSWQVNTRAAAQFQGFLNDLYKAGYTGMVSSGGYANRPIRGGTIPSEHAYGAAIDIGAEKNPLQYVSAGTALRTDLPSNVGDIAAKWGLKWGGTFTGRQDPMHFEVAALMTPEQLQAARSGTVTTGGPPPTPGSRATGISINTPLSSLLGTTAAAPPQVYRPPPGREPEHWGRTPEHDWTPGSMPTAHDIPQIMGGLLPLALTLFAGFALGGGLGAVAAFTGYQNARNKGQQEAAKEAKTQWQDRLKETEAALKEELLESSGLMAEYGNDFTSPGAQQAWGELAAKYQDTQLRAALESGNTAAVGELFKKRDEAFQTLSKTSAAATKATEQEEAAAKAKADEGAMGFPETPGAGGGTGAPAGPEKPWENLGPGFAGGGQPAVPPAAPGAGGPSAGAAPPPSAPQPAAAPAPSEQPPEQPAPEEPAPAPAPPGTPSATLPPVSVTAPAEPPPQPPAGAPRTPFEAMVSDVVNGEEIEKLKPAISADGLKKLQFAAADKENQIEAVKPGPQAAAQLKAIDPTFGYYAEGVSNYTMPDPTARSQNRGYIARLFAAAQKINPYWDYKDYATKQEFRTSFNPDKDVGKTLSRTSRLMNLTKELADDAAHLPNTNVASFNNLIAWFQGKEVGDPRYTKFIADWRLFANDAQAVASGKGIPPVTLTSHLIDTLQMGATPQMIRQGIKEDLLAALSSVDPSIAGWHVQFPGQANPGMFDQGIYGQLNQYAHMNIETGAVPEALPDVGTSQQWGGQTHYYLGGDITNKNNWSLVKPPGTQ